MQLAPWFEVVHGATHSFVQRVSGATRQFRYSPDATNLLPAENTNLRSITEVKQHRTQSKLRGVEP